MNNQVKNVLHDVLPTVPEPYSEKLVRYVEYLYKSSLGKQPKMPHQAEHARYHICAFIGAEKYQQELNLPDPVTNKIPVPPKILIKVFESFRNNVLDGQKSPFSSPTKPMTPPRLNRVNTLSPQKSASRVSSPLKRLQAVRDEDDDDVKKRKVSLNDAESPFNPKTPTTSPTKSKTSTPTSPRYTKQLSIRDFISFANNFYIPSSITTQMVESFLDQKHKFTKKSEWLLACGMIHAAYIRINHKLIESKMGAKGQLQDQLFQYQKGGLMKWNMILWINILEDAIKNEPWIMEVERKFIDGTWTSKEDQTPKEIAAKLSTKWDITLQMGSMIFPDHLYHLQSQQDYYNTWTSRVLSQLK